VLTESSSRGAKRRGDPGSSELRSLGSLRHGPSGRTGVFRRPMARDDDRGSRRGPLPARMATVYVPSAFSWRTVLCVARCVAAFLEAMICRKSEFVVLLVFEKVFYSRRPRLINPGADPKPALADPSAKPAQDGPAGRKEMAPQRLEIAQNATENGGPCRHLLGEGRKALNRGIGHATRAHSHPALQ
jgi:hypothetical protein